MVLMHSEVQTLLSEASLKTSEGGAKNYPKLAHGRKWSIINFCVPAKTHDLFLARASKFHHLFFWESS